MTAPRTILHADLDAFFASVEQLDHPEMRGQPVLVGGRSGRSVVATASYEARRFGCRSAMPMTRALTLCPHAVVATPRFERYSELSDQFMEILGRYSPLVEA
ncbi:MAG: DNA polymerase IV, partial [Planctomycetota bacterium]